MNSKCPIEKTCLEYPRCGCGPSAIPLISLEVLTPPVYDNTRLHVSNRQLWVLDNKRELLRYFNALSPYCEGEPLVDFDRFCLCQRDAQEMRALNKSEFLESVS